MENSPYGEVRASQLTAVAAKDNVSSIVEVISFEYHKLEAKGANFI